MLITQRNLMMLTAAVAAAAVPARVAEAVLPISGMPVPELAVFDDAMNDFMESNDIDAGVLGIMKDGVIVYQRGFGWKDSGHTTPLRHDAPMRIASCTKPFTAAAVQRLIAGGFLDPNDFVFDLGQAGGGILQPGTYVPFPALGDTRFDQIRVRDLYLHRGGWDRSLTPDPTYREVRIADDFNDAGIPTAYPPGRVKTARWIIGQPLDFTPGTQRQYSNVGFMLLGLIVEQISGVNHLTYIRNNVLGPFDWVPVTELVQGRTFPDDRDPREPWYDDDAMVQNVFDPDGPSVRRPAGGWDHEARIGQGGIACSTTMLLHLGENYYISDRQVSDSTYGMPTGGARDDRWHNGSMPGGTMSMNVQRSDGINFAVIVNKNGTDVASPDPNNPNGYHFAIKTLIEDTIDAGGFTWPTQGVDGQWVDFAYAAAGSGSYEDPWNDVDGALAGAAEEATLNVRPSVSNWTGVINQKVRIRAPEGNAVIGQQ